MEYTYKKVLNPVTGNLEWKRVPYKAELAHPDDPVFEEFAEKAGGKTSIHVEPASKSSKVLAIENISPHAMEKIQDMMKQIAANYPDQMLSPLRMVHDPIYGLRELEDVPTLPLLHENASEGLPDAQEATPDSLFDGRIIDLGDDS
jgi:hypothetical protein